MPTIFFTDADDIYTVTAAGDYSLIFLGGRDTLTVDGGTSTTAAMGDDDDIVKLISGLATVYGESGADRFEVWAAGVIAYGGSGDDKFNLRGGSAQALYGDSGIDRFYFYFNGVDVLLDGGDGNDLFYGNEHAISGNIYGAGGNEYFIGFNGSGSVSLHGGLGNDTYRAGSTTPATFVENAGEGVDIVQVSRGFSYTLPTNIDRIVVGNYAGSTDAAATLTGNAIANVIVAAGNDDTLNGLDGNDALHGRDGDDTLNGGNGNDRLYGGNGIDTLNGDSGADVLDGGAGDDTMLGGIGSDAYYVDSTGDTVAENASEGTDTVRVYLLEYTLPDHIENGVLIVGGVLHGNSLNNSLTGNYTGDSLYGYDGNDVLDGGNQIEIFSEDTLYGGIGDDKYYVDAYPNASFDTVIENTDEGTDTVYIVPSSAPAYDTNLYYTLPANVENGTIVSHPDIAFNGLMGNGLDNLLTGGSAHDTISGGAGNDTLVGGANSDELFGETGNDTFAYTSTSDSNVAGFDTIHDFTSVNGEGSDDQIDLSAIDADTTIEGDQAFAVQSSGAPLGTPGDMWYTYTVDGDGTVNMTFYGDVDGDGIADFQLLVHTVSVGISFDDLIW